MAFLKTSIHNFIYCAFAFWQVPLSAGGKNAAHDVVPRHLVDGSDWQHVGKVVRAGWQRIEVRWRWRKTTRTQRDQHRCIATRLPKAQCDIASLAWRHFLVLICELISFAEYSSFFERVDTLHTRFKLPASLSYFLTVRPPQWAWPIFMAPNCEQAHLSQSLITTRISASPNHLVCRVVDPQMKKSLQERCVRYDCEPVLAPFPALLSKVW